MEQLIERKLIGAISGLRNGTKTANDVEMFLNKMKDINPLLADDFEKKYNEALLSRNH